MKVLNHNSGFPLWGSDKATGNSQRIWPWGPAGFDYRPSRGMRETETPVLEATNKILCSPRPIGEEQWPRSRLNQNYLMVLEGLVGWWGLTAGTGALEGSPWASTLLEFTSNPTIGPIDPRTGLPQAEQLPGRECSPTHRQICGLKLYWARPYPQEQDPVFPITSLSHQEAYTNFLTSSIREYTEEPPHPHSD